MTQERMKKYFESELGQQCTSLFSTPDDMVFIRYNEALNHCNDNNLSPFDILEWFEEWCGSDITPQIRSIIAFIEKESETDWRNAEVLAVEKYGEDLTREAINIMSKGVRMANYYIPTNGQCFDAMSSAIQQLTEDHPEFQEEGTTGKDMLYILHFIKNHLKTK